MTTKTTLSTRPTENSERATLVKFSDGIDAKALPEGCALMLSQFRTAASAYAAARTAKTGAAAAAHVCGLSVGTTATAFQRAFYRWSNSVDDANTEGFAEKELHPLLGDKCRSEFFDCGARYQVDTMVAVFAYVDVNEVLVGDPARLTAVKGATTAFDAAVTASEAALRTRATAVVAFAAATAEFDRRWGRVVDELRLGAPALAAQIPTFRRVTSGPVPPTEPTGGEPTTTEPTTTEPATTEPPADPPVT